ncbi:hypothetical protein AAG906_029785 [Vitis piasezkii]
MGSVRRMKLGLQGLEVSAQGLGCMGMSAFYGPPKPEEDMIALIHHAVNSGITLLDTSDMYGPSLMKSFSAREKVELASKFGIIYADGKRDVRGDPAYVRAACEASLKRLEVDCIDLYYQHRIDTRVPIEVTIGELKKLVEEGKIKYIGLSEASASTIRRAHAVHPITAVQLEWSLWTRDVEEEIVPTCRELGIGIVAYSPLGRGFFSSGTKLIENLSNNDFRKNLPRFQPENLGHNKILYERIENLKQNIGALSVKLTPEEMAELESIASADGVKGDRYESTAFTWKTADTPPLDSWKSTCVHPITNVALEWSLWLRDVEEDIVPTCRELGIGIVAYSPLGRGFLSLGPRWPRTCQMMTTGRSNLISTLPRFQPENIEHNNILFERVKEIATRKGCTTSQLALAWVHHQGMTCNIGALSLTLTPDEMAELESIASAFAIKGDRFLGTSLTWKASDAPLLASWKS